MLKLRPKEGKEWTSGRWALHPELWASDDPPDHHLHEGKQSSRGHWSLLPTHTEKLRACERLGPDLTTPHCQLGGRNVHLWPYSDGRLVSCKLPYLRASVPPRRTKASGPSLRYTHLPKWKQAGGGPWTETWGTSTNPESSIAIWATNSSGR